MNQWRNWSGWIRCEPQAILTPANEAVLSRAVAGAAGPVRVAGSGHSFTPLCETPGTLISLDALQGVVSTDFEAKTAVVRAGTKVHALGRPLFDAGLALKNQGDIDRQAIAGAVSTGTHGTSPELGSLSSEVKAFRLVTATGEPLSCSRTENVEIFEAGRVAFGSLGVLSELTLQLRAKYKLRERNWVMPAEECWRRLNELRDAHRHFEFFWFPHAEAVVAKSLSETDEAAPEPLTSEQMKTRGERVTADQRAFQFGCELARAFPGQSAVLQRFFTKASMGASTRIRWSHEIFPSPRTVRFNEMEYAVPAVNGVDCIREIAEAIRSRRIGGVFPLEFRFVRADDIWLSPFYKRDAVTVSVHQYHRQSYDELFACAEAIFKRYGGRPHWGKLHRLGPREFEKLYPRWQDFLSVRRRLDPEGKFLNTHLRHIFGVGDG